jgi:hypothetical protein
MAFKEDKAARVAAAKKLHSGGSRTTGLANLNPMDIIGVGLDVAKLIPGAGEIASGIDKGLDIVKSAAPDALGEEAPAEEAEPYEPTDLLNSFAKGMFANKREKEMQEANLLAEEDRAEKLSSYGKKGY